MKKLEFGLLLILIAVPGVCRAETVDHGGYEARFIGGGDKIPPQCQFAVPSGARSPFFAKWNCVDDNASQHDIRTELWIYRKNDQAPQLISNFLGFPAASYIDQNILRVTNFTDGLPVSLRLLARDTAGNTTVSPFLTVRSQAASFSTCTLSIITEATDSTGGTTGTPAQTVSLETPNVTTQQISDSVFRIATTSAQEAQTCEISAVCVEDSRVSFDASITIENDSASPEQTTLSASPGSVAADVTAASVSLSDDGAEINSATISGSATIDSAEASISLSCAN